MPYIGRSEKMGVRTVFHYLASNGTTSISGADVDGKTLSFVDGNYIDVYLNGVRLKKGEDFNTSTANTVAGLAALNANDEVNIVVYDAFSIADVVPASSGGSFGGNISLTSDNAVLSFGADSDIKITHDPDDGLFLKSTATADDNPFVLTLQTGETDIAQDDILGQILFQAPDEGTGTDAITSAARIQAISEGDFSSSSNATSLELRTATSGVVGTAAQGSRLTLQSDANMILKDMDTADGSSPTLTLQSGDTDIAQSDVLGTINFQAPDEGTGTDAILVAAGISAESEGDFSSSSNATSLKFTTASSAAAAIGGTDGGEMTLLSNGALLLRDKRTTGAPTLALQAGRTDVSQGDVLGGIEFSAPVEASGTDAILVGASINAAADADYSSSSNATALQFKTGTSETAATKFYIASSGDIVINSNTNNAKLQFQDASNSTGYVIQQIGSSGSPALRFMTSAGSESMRILNGGDIVVGKTAASAATNGLQLEAAGTGYFSRPGALAVGANRNTDDGEVIRIQQDGTSEGTISISGSTCSYNAFTGSHWSRLVDNSKPDLLRGTVVETIDEMCDWYQAEYTSQEEEKYEDGDNIPAGKKVGDVKSEKIIVKDSIALPSGKSVGDTITHTVDGVDYSAKILKEKDYKHVKCKVSDTADCTNVYGVFLSWDTDDDNVNDMYVNAIGTSVVRVHKDQTVSKGDLLVSNGDGTAKKQSDGIIRSKTIGKVLTNIKQETYSDGSYLIPCALYCG